MDTAGGTHTTFFLAAHPALRQANKDRVESQYIHLSTFFLVSFMSKGPKIHFKILSFSFSPVPRAYWQRS
jgi:hypothetical protein